MKKASILTLAVLLAAAACSEGPTDPTSLDGNLDAPAELVITEGVRALPRAPAKPLFSTLEDARVSLGGSTTTPLSLNGASCAESSVREVTITYTVSGSQRSPASFKVFTKWSYDGTAFSGSVPTMIHVDARQGTPSTHQVPITVENTSGLGSGESHFIVAPFDLVTNTADPGGQQLRVDATSSATIYVEFNDCTPEPPANTEPSLTLPADMEVEATSSGGAVVTFIVTASDFEDGDLTDDVVCTPASGDLFPFGETVVNCSVIDSGGLSAEGSFKVTVEDTTAPVFTSFADDQILIAANINGAVLNLDFESFGITAEDQGPNGEPGDISGPVTIVCDYTAGTWLPLGSITTVSCTATDARGNKSDPESFEVFVTLNLTGVGFLQPLRMTAPFSAHKAGSAIPHKFPAPRYEDGTPATDLADKLRLVLTRNDSNEKYVQTEGDEFAAGSTVWRYGGDYIFNLKSEKGWGAGEWTTTVSIGHLTIATTTFALR
jgi:hypothetical protein